jgi:hypothetical protein
MLHHHHPDRGYKSRKLHMAYVVMALGTIGFLLTGWWPALGLSYPEYCMFLLGASGIYVGGNAAVKWMGAKQAPSAAPPKQTALSEQQDKAEVPPKNPNAD